MRAAALALALVLAGGGGARAGGRFPAAVSVAFRPQHAADIYVGTTFGLLVSHDDGASFRWVCEENIGYEGTFDPKYRVAANGTIYATTFAGLRVSRDGGCSFTTALAGVWIEAIDIGSDGAVWVVSAEAGRSNDVYRSTDGGKTFARLGLETTTAWWKSVVVAPGDARRAYVTGYQVTQVGPDGGAIAPTVHLYRTDDAGASWTMLGIGAFALGPSPLLIVEEVAADDSQLVFVRSVRAVPPAGDKLYRSLDGGETFAEVLTTTDAIRGVVMRADGTVLVATQLGGMHRSSDRGATFTRSGDLPQAACLGDRGDALFACGANWEPDMFAIGKSGDGGASWSRVLRFVEMKGPLACPAGTAQRDVCAARIWPALAKTFGVAVTPSPPDEPAPPRPRSSQGCCDSRAAPASPVIAVLVVAVGLLVRRRKRT